MADDGDDDENYLATKFIWILIITVLRTRFAKVLERAQRKQTGRNISNLQSN